MRKLIRPLPEPQGLSDYDYNTTKWTKSTPSKKCRNSIWEQLDAMQGGFCVYCESIAIKGNGHIEHFFHKGQKPDGTTPYKYLTFDWTNLFASCGLNSSNTCGHYKDLTGEKGPKTYNPIDLIKPDVEDPKDFFIFLDTGVIQPKSNLCNTKLKRANETIRVLNLNALNGARQSQIKIFKDELNELFNLSANLSENELKLEIDKIKSNINKFEYKTAVMSALFG